MTDYTARTRRSPLKAAAIWVLTRTFINAPLIRLLSALPDSDWRARIPVVKSSAELILDNCKPVVMTAVERCQIAREIVWGRGRLRSASDRNALDIAIRLSRDAEVFLDVGAYTGLFALAVARCNPGIRCYAYEIVPENFQILVANVIANNLVVRVCPQLKGVGAELGSIRVPVTFGAGVLASSVALDSKSDVGVEIPVSSLDSLHHGGLKKIVIKIDVEGFEYDVLRGAVAMLNNAQVDIVCEVLRRAPHISETENLLRQAGYRIFHIKQNGVQISDRIVPDKHDRDWLFTRRNDDDLTGIGIPVLQPPAVAEMQ